MNMEEWKILRSKSGKSPIGHPIGEYLCRSDADVKRIIEEKQILDAVIEKYSFDEHCKYTLKVK